MHVLRFPQWALFIRAFREGIEELVRANSDSGDCEFVNSNGAIRPRIGAGSKQITLSESECDRRSKPSTGMLRLHMRWTIDSPGLVTFDFAEEDEDTQTISGLIDVMRDWRVPFDARSDARMDGPVTDGSSCDFGRFAADGRYQVASRARDQSDGPAYESLLAGLEAGEIDSVIGTLREYLRPPAPPSPIEACGGDWTTAATRALRSYALADCTISGDLADAVCDLQEQDDTASDALDRDPDLRALWMRRLASLNNQKYIDLVLEALDLTPSGADIQAITQTEPPLEMSRAHIDPKGFAYLSAIAARTALGDRVRQASDAAPT